MQTSSQHCPIQDINLVRDRTNSRATFSQQRRLDRCCCTQIAWHSFAASMKLVCCSFIAPFGLCVGCPAFSLFASLLVVRREAFVCVAVVGDAAATTGSTTGVNAEVTTEAGATEGG